MLNFYVSLGNLINIINIPTSFYDFYIAFPGLFFYPAIPNFSNPTKIRTTNYFCLLPFIPMYFSGFKTLGHWFFLGWITDRNQVYGKNMLRQSK